ncbi:unnamed protein product [Effrenium voratum]|nr:unnamed protein product [Effrenium voratum]
MLGAPSGGGFGGPGHLESIGRRWELHPEEHRNLPPTGLPSSASGASAPGSFGSQASAQPLLQVPSSVPNASWTGGPPASGGNVRISVPRLMDDGRLGLIIQNCWVSSISNPTAAQFGWQVGDHILQVNGHPVSNMQQLSEEIRRAVNSHQAGGAVPHTTGRQGLPSVLILNEHTCVAPFKKLKKGGPFFKRNLFRPLKKPAKPSRLISAVILAITHTHTHKKLAAKPNVHDSQAATAPSAQAVAHPLVFDVWRASPQALSAAAAASGVQRRQKMACCDWDACDCLGSDPAPTGYAPSPAYGAQGTGYGTPNPGYGAPPSAAYGAPSAAYGAPSAAYGAPSAYGAPGGAPCAQAGAQRRRALC